nr:Coiled-coil domain-containing protein 12 [Euglena gracilis]
MSGGAYDPGAAAAELEEEEEEATPAAPASAAVAGPAYDPLAAPAAAEEEEAEDEDSDFEEDAGDPAGEGAAPGGQPAVRFRNYQPDGADASGSKPYDPTATNDHNDEEEDEEEEEGEDEGEQKAAKRAKVDHPGPGPQGAEANGGGEEEDEEDEEEEEEEDAEDEPPKKEVKFRNYNPRDKELKAAKVKRPKEVVDDGDLSAEIQAEDAKPKPEGEDSLASLLPQKRDHDLRKLVEPKLQLLQRRTQKVLLRIIQDRIKQQEQEEGEGEEMEEDEDAEEDVPA